MPSRDIVIKDLADLKSRKAQLVSISSASSAEKVILYEFIGMALLKYLPQGEITRDDYDKAGHLKFFSIDMKFAMQIGLVERITRKKYKIKEHIDKSYQNLAQPQRTTLSALYEFFADDVFSVEMVTAKLDYSSAHISGFLHQFTWMRLLDCKESENKTYEYRFRVNPTDNPECFISAAYPYMSL